MPELIRTPKVLHIYEYPSPVLSKVSLPVVQSIKDDLELQDFINDLTYTMQYHRAIGIAAPQTGVHLRVLVVQDERQEPIKVINPVIKDTDGESWREEGCLSIPGLYTKIRRPEEVTIQYFNENGEIKTTINNGLLGRAILHEMDHLSGLTIFDKLSKVERQIVTRKWKLIKRKFAKPA